MTRLQSELERLFRARPQTAAHAAVLIGPAGTVRAMALRIDAKALLQPGH